MKLNYRVKSLVEAALDDEVDVIAHQCNCHKRMKSGIAPQIAKAFPEAEQVDLEDDRGPLGRFGDLTYAVSKSYTGAFVEIFNLYGQYNYGYDSKMYTDYKSLEESFLKMKSLLEPGSKIGFPKLGCGLAGGNWKVVSQLIENIFADFDVTIYVLKEEEIV